MSGEYLNLCACRLVNLRREGNEVVAEIRCKIEAAEETAEAEGLEKTKVLGQVSEPAPAQVLLEQK